MCGKQIVCRNFVGNLLEWDRGGGGNEDRWEIRVIEGLVCAENVNQSHRRRAVVLVVGGRMWITTQKNKS